MALAGKLMSVELALAMAATRYMLSLPLHAAMPAVQLAAALLWLPRWATKHLCLTTTRPLRVMQPAAATCLRGGEGGDCAPYLSVWVRLINDKCQMSTDKKSIDKCQMSNVQMFKVKCRVPPLMRARETKRA